MRLLLRVDLGRHLEHPKESGENYCKPSGNSVKETKTEKPTTFKQTINNDLEDITEEETPFTTVTIMEYLGTHLQRNVQKPTRGKLKNTPKGNESGFEQTESQHTLRKGMRIS